MRVQLVPSDGVGTSSVCLFCGEWFLVGIVVGKVSADEREPTSCHVGVVQEIADREPRNPWAVCPTCWSGGGDVIRERATRRAMDLAQQAFDHVRLLDALRATNFELPTLSLEAYYEIALQPWNPPRRHDGEDPTPASR